MILVVIFVSSVQFIVWNAKIYPISAQNVIQVWIDIWNSKNVNVKMDFMIANSFNVSRVILVVRVVLIFQLAHHVIRINRENWLMANVNVNKVQ